MAEVMTASGLRASTLYEYFSNKDEIVWAIFSDVMKEDSVRAKIAVDGAATGLAKIMALSDHMAINWRSFRPRFDSCRSLTPCTRETGRWNAF